MYERLTDQLFLRVDEMDEIDAREVCTRFAEAFESRLATEEKATDQLLRRHRRVA
jgi:hypothetical protein